MDGVINRLTMLFSPAKIGDFVFGKLLPDAVVGLIVFCSFYFLWKVISRIVAAVLKRTEIDATATGFIQTVLKYIILTIGLITALSQVGVNTFSLVTSLGVAGLTIGFAAKDVLSNIISGLFIFWDRPFVIGDLIEIGDHYGRVDIITMRSTRVVTSDGRMLSVPNTEIINSTVASYTNFPHLRLEIDATVGLYEDLNQVRRILLGLAENDERFMQEPKPEMVVTALNDYNIAIQLRIWIKDERQHITCRFELREKLFEKFREKNIEMPYETIYIKSQSTDNPSMV